MLQASSSRRLIFWSSESSASFFLGAENPYLSLMLPMPPKASRKCLAPFKSPFRKVTASWRSQVAQCASPTCSRSRAMSSSLSASCILFSVAERSGSPTPGQRCSIVSGDAILAFGAAGWFGNSHINCWRVRKYSMPSVSDDVILPCQSTAGVILEPFWTTRKKSFPS